MCYLMEGVPVSRQIILLKNDSVVFYPESFLLTLVIPDRLLTDDMAEVSQSSVVDDRRWSILISSSIRMAY